MRLRFSGAFRAAPAMVLPQLTRSARESLSQRLAYLRRDTGVHLVVGNGFEEQPQATGNGRLPEKVLPEIFWRQALVYRIKLKAYLPCNEDCFPDLDGAAEKRGELLRFGTFKIDRDLIDCPSLRPGRWLRRLWDGNRAWAFPRCEPWRSRIGTKLNQMRPDVRIA